MTPREFASQFRYSEDKPTKKFIEVNNELEVFDVHNSLLVTKTVSPIIYSSLERAAKNLLIDHNNINMYVHASSEINAMCYNGIDDGYVVILSSALINLLKDKELDFVIGHELGHLLFGHTKEQKIDSAEGMKLSRAKELSVDRIGLVATRDLDATLRAVIKIISGLSDKFLNFNVLEFIDQLRKFDIDASGMLGQTTHPSFLIRARALLLFSTSDKYQYLLDKDGKNLFEVDKAIKREMDKYIDKSFNEETKRLKDNFNFWITCFSAIADKSLSKEEQSHIAEKYGEDKLNKFKGMIEGRSLSEIEILVNKKLLQASDALAKFRSISVNDDIDEIVKDLTVRFKIDNLKEKVLNLFNLNE
jgi:hypothetical protein